MKREYTSSIPQSAVERVIERYARGQKKTAEYLLRGKVVGRRWFYESGQVQWEYGLKSGLKDGLELEWYESGQLSFAEPWRKGRIHGAAQQWDERGRLVGTYTIKNGTGWDLWRQPRMRGGLWYLAEAIYYLDGTPHGCQWFIDENQRTIHAERQLCRGNRHGMERWWTKSSRRPDRGYPKFFVHGEQVAKRQYLKACRTDPTLPPFREEDNKALRQFPPPVARALRPLKPHKRPQESGR